MQEQLHDITDHPHPHHWEVSWAPMAAGFGVMFLVALPFSSYFVYHNKLLAVLFAGIGAPLVLAGIAKWIQEGASQKMAIENVSPIGIGVFIIGEILIFIGLFASYWTLRLSAEGAWPPAGTPHIDKFLPLVMTVLLVASSMTYHAAETKLGADDEAGFIKWLVASIILGVLFLGCTTYEYGHLSQAGFNPGTNQYSAAFYTLTGFHAAHVLLGVLAFVSILIAVTRMRINPLFVTVVGIYWHFVDVVWFFVASQVYFW